MEAIKCANCLKTQARMKYSKTQMKDYESRRRSATIRRGKEVTGPLCRACTGEPPTEFQCFNCEMVLERNKYSAAQLRRKDKRLCIDCSQERQDREASVAAAVQEEQILEELRERAGGEESAWGTSSLRSALPSATNSGFPSATASRADDGVWIRDDSSVGYGNTVRQDDNESETSTQMGVSTTGTARTNGTWENFAPIERTHARPQASATSRSTNPGFHKQGAVKKDAAARAQDRFQRDQRREQQDSDQLDSESEDDDDDDPWEL